MEWGMQLFPRALKILGVLFLLPCILHLALGLGADAMLGAQVPKAAASDPGLDSQNRFYGVIFSLYGILLIVCASDLAKYATILRLLLWVFFAGGIARLVSIAAVGMPPAAVVVLLITELVIPPLLLWGLQRELRSSV
jgi:hypothetical protein